MDVSKEKEAWKQKKSKKGDDGMRLIDKDALLKIFHRYYGNDLIEVEDVIGWIEEQPTIEERKWIPCSERLPEENTPVLLGVRFKDDFKYFVTARMDYNYWTGLGREIRGEMRWCELPEPYKGENDES